MCLFKRRMQRTETRPVKSPIFQIVRNLKRIHRQLTIQVPEALAILGGSGACPRKIFKKKNMQSYEIWGTWGRTFGNLNLSARSQEFCNKAYYYVCSTGPGLQVGFPWHRRFWHFKVCYIEICQHLTSDTISVDSVYSSWPTINWHNEMKKEVFCQGTV
jgi:hypothetical protein